MPFVIVELKPCRQLFTEQWNGSTNDVRVFKILSQSKSFLILIGLLKWQLYWDVQVFGRSIFWDSRWRKYYQQTQSYCSLKNVFNSQRNPLKRNQKGFKAIKAILIVLFPRSESLLRKRWACTNETFVQAIIKTKKCAQRQLIDRFDTTMTSIISDKRLLRPGCLQCLIKKRLRSQKLTTWAGCIMIDFQL